MLRITMSLVGQPNVSVTFVLDRVLDAKEFVNIHKGNVSKVGAAIGRRRLARLGVVGFPKEVVYA